VIEIVVVSCNAITQRTVTKCLSYDEGSLITVISTVFLRHCFVWKRKMFDCIQSAWVNFTFVPLWHQSLCRWKYVLF